MCGQWRPRLDFVDVQSDQGLHFLLTESLDTNYWIPQNVWEQSPVSYFFVHVQDDLNLHSAHVQRHLFAWRGPSANIVNNMLEKILLMHSNR